MFDPVVTIFDSWFKTEHLVNKCIDYLTQRTKSGAQIWSSALTKCSPSLPVLPVLPPGGTLYSTWILSQI
jgi:hypothetical protein